MNATLPMALPARPPAAGDVSAPTAPGHWMWRSEAFAEDLEELLAPSAVPQPTSARAPLLSALFSVALVGAIGLLLALP